MITYYVVSFVLSRVLTRRGLCQYGRDELLRELERIHADDGGNADAFHVEAQDLPQIVAARLQTGHAEPEISRGLERYSEISVKICTYSCNT